MPTRFDTSIFLGSPDATAAVARSMAPLLGRGDCLLLEGPIGAGKSHFARALVQTRLAAQGLFEDVPSPTYTLVQTYDDGLLEIWHADLYRLSGADEVVELGLADAFETAICLVEWPDRLGGDLPPNALTLSFDAGPTETSRNLKMTSRDPHWASRLSATFAHEGAGE